MERLADYRRRKESRANRRVHGQVRSWRHADAVRAASVGAGWGRLQSVCRQRGDVSVQRPGADENRPLSATSTARYARLARFRTAFQIRADEGPGEDPERSEGLLRERAGGIVHVRSDLDDLALRQRRRFVRKSRNLHHRLPRRTDVRTQRRLFKGMRPQIDPRLDYSMRRPGRYEHQSRYEPNTGREAGSHGFSQSRLTGRS